ncbi:MAG: DUF86 domain-containing protein [Firmicutes bacterium]|nr:DUF86 domain-containing protein [Bacillota bacterium]
MVDQEKIRQKLHFIRQQLKELDRFKAMDEGEFTEEPLYEAAATRMLQISIEAMLDLCSHVIARKGWGLPKTYVEIVEIAARHGLIPKDLEATYKDMARFRNRVVHLYHDIDPKEIYRIAKLHSDNLQPFIALVIDRYLGE